ERAPRAGGQGRDGRGDAVRVGVVSCGLLGAALLAVAACGGPPDGNVPRGGNLDLPRAFREAFREEAVGDPERATRAYLHAIELAAASDGDPWQLPAVDASL